MHNMFKRSGEAEQKAWHTLPQKKQRRKELRGQLESLESTREKISESAFEQLKSKYERELGELEVAIGEAQNAGETERADLDVRRSTAEEKQKKAKGELEELETLSVGGAIGEKEYRERKRELERTMSAAAKEERRLTRERDELDRSLSAEEPFSRSPAGGAGAGLSTLREWAAGLASTIGAGLTRVGAKKGAAVAAAVVVVAAIAIIAVVMLRGPRSPGEVVEAFLEAVVEADGAAMVELVSDDGLEPLRMQLERIQQNPERSAEQVSGEGIEMTAEEIEELDLAGFLSLILEVEDLEEFEEISGTVVIENEREDGNTATVEMSFEDDGERETEEIELEREDGRWVFPSFDL